MDMAAALLKLLMSRESGRQEEDSLTDTSQARFADKSNGRADDRAPGKFRNGKTQQPWNRKPMVRLFFNVGSKMQVAPRDLVGAIAGETGIPGRSIGAIEIHDRFSFVEVAPELADDVMNVMNGSQIRGFRVAVEKAVPKS